MVIARSRTRDGNAFRVPPRASRNSSSAGGPRKPVAQRAEAAAEGAPVASAGADPFKTAQHDDLDNSLFRFHALDCAVCGAGSNACVGGLNPYYSSQGSCGPLLLCGSCNRVVHANCCGTWGDGFGLVEAGDEVLARSRYLLSRGRL